MNRLKNYTSSVNAGSTLSHIESYLIAAGASGIAKQIKNGRVDSLVFEITDERGKMRLIRLPANVEAVVEHLWKDYCGKTRTPRKNKDDFYDQAERTAWKIMQDWVQVQLSLIQLKQADVLQVFLSYVWDGHQTYYEYLKGGSFRALPAPSTEEKP